MAKTKLAKKRRLARAHAHQFKTRTPPEVVFTEQVVGGPLAPWQKQLLAQVTNTPRTREDVRSALKKLKAEYNVGGHAVTGPTVDTTKGDDGWPGESMRAEPVDDPVKVPTRAKCPQCGFSQKVRKNGLMSRHDVYLGSDPQECAGTGQRWDA